MLTLQQSGLPGSDARRARLSLHEARIERSLQALGAKPAAWTRLVADLERSLQAEFELARARARFMDALREAVAQPATSTLEAVGGWFAHLRDDLEACEATLEVAEGVPTAPPPRALHWSEPSFVRALDALEERLVPLRSPAALQRLSLELRASIERLPEHLELAENLDEHGRRVTPDAVRFKTVEPRRLAASRLVERLLPDLETATIELAGRLSSYLTAVREVEAVVQHGVEQGDRAVLERARGVVNRVRSELETSRQTAVDLEAMAARAFEAAARLLTRSAPEGGVLESRHWLRRLVRASEAPRRRLHRRLEAGQAALGRLVRALGDLTRGAAELERRPSSSPDAASLALVSAAWLARPELPASYARLVSLEPVREPRLFTARKPLLERLIQAETRWLAGGPSSALIVGSHGSGRTSLLNVCQLNLSASRVLRPEALESRRGALLPALALELRCSAQPAALRQALGARKTSVLIDDLEEWFVPNLAGIAELQTVLQLIMETQADVFWIATSAEHGSALWSEVEPLRHAFAHAMALAPLSGAELRQAIEARHLLSGLPLEYRSPLGIRWLRRLGSGSEPSVFFNVLSRASGGNLSRALRVFAGSVDVEPARVVVVTERSLALKVPGLARLAVVEQAALSELLRFGPSDVASLGARLDLEEAEARRLVSFLRASGLVEATASRRGERLGVPARMRPMLSQELQRLGVLAEREAP